MRSSRPTPSASIAAPKSAADGSMCGAGLALSDSSSMSRKRAPGICAARYSARASRPLDWHEDSSNRRRRGRARQGSRRAIRSRPDRPWRARIVAVARAAARWRAPWTPTHLGKTSALPASPEAAVLDYVPNPRAGALYLVRFAAPEFTSLCPVTGQPDFAHLVIDYAPGDDDRRIQEPEAVPRLVPQPLPASTRT